MATDNLCGTVHVTWSINTVLGLDEFHIYRNGTMIGTAPHGSAGDDHQYVDNSPLPAAAEYCVFGFSNVCGLGDEDCDQGQSGSAPTGCVVSNVEATDDDCDEVCITWTATCPDVTEFQVLRATILVGTVPAAGGPNYSFCHAAPAGAAGGYQIRPVNACGNGTSQPSPPESGLRQAAPGNVTGISASDTLCDKVVVTWTDLAAADQYEVRRNPGGTLATVAGDVNTYDDLTAVAGSTYNYTVVGLNECGVGSVATGNGGTRRASGTGTALYTLVTAGPPNWTYSMDVTSGCLDRVKIRDYCDGTTATAPAGWTANVYGLDSIIFSTTTAVGAQDAIVTGFVLSHPTCDGDGRWNVGQSGGSIRGPLPVGDNAALPTEYSVNVFPNPFNPMTNFRIAIPQASETRILVFNIAGQLVRDMSMGRMQAGYHTVQFGGSDLPSGMYFARIQAGNFHSTHKLMLLK
ncbi:MAG: T9SS type A sorting domain-containing protein [bacterium]|nr:T9SS type A sorting domain-containing protein [bacterium]